jgi:hypothetical protein
MLSKRILVSTVFVCVLMLGASICCADQFVAVYLDPNTFQYGYSTGGNLEFAKRQAQDACGGACVFVAWTKNACVAVATANDGGTCYGGDWGANLGLAESRAIEACQGRGCGCKVIFKRCTE